MRMTHTTNKPTEVWLVVIAAVFASVFSLLMLPLKYSLYDGSMHEEFIVQFFTINSAELLSDTLQTAWLYFLSAIASMQLFRHSDFFVKSSRRAISVGGIVAAFIMMIFLVFPPFDTSSGAEEWVKTFLYFNVVLNFLPFLVVNGLACKLMDR